MARCSGWLTSTRRLRRMAPTGNSAMGCHDSGSPDNSMAGAAGPTGMGICPSRSMACIMVASRAQPAQMSAFTLRLAVSEGVGGSSGVRR